MGVFIVKRPDGTVTRHKNMVTDKGKDFVFRSAFNLFGASPHFINTGNWYIGLAKLNTPIADLPTNLDLSTFLSTYAQEFTNYTSSFASTGNRPYWDYSSMNPDEIWSEITNTQVDFVGTSTDDVDCLFLTTSQAKGNLSGGLFSLATTNLSFDISLPSNFNTYNIVYAVGPLI